MASDTVLIIINYEHGYWNTILRGGTLKRLPVPSSYGASADFLSAIFGFYGKFLIDLCVPKKVWDFFRCEKHFQKIFFRWFLKIFGKSQNFIGIWMIPCITRYKGNHPNPYRILGFSKNFQKILKFFQITFFCKIFSSRKNVQGIFSNTYVDPKFSKDSKNHT